MPLIDVRVDIPETRIPQSVTAFLREANRRIEEYQQQCHVPGFVASDFGRAYHVLDAVRDAGLAQGDLFCEWGSGFGVVASLASMVGFEACGIEVEEDLVEQASQLADDFAVSVQFLRGSFLPRGAIKPSDAEAVDGLAWLKTDTDQWHEDLGLAPDDFDVIFAYPWPDEEDVTQRIFRRYAAEGALLVSYHGGDEFRVRRKVAKK